MERLLSIGLQGAPGPRMEDEKLARLVALARAARAEEIAGDAERLGERLHEGRFFVAVLGQYKRGKSTLVNALIGAPALPTGVAPVTSVVTVVRFGTLRRARVLIPPGGWQEIPPDRLADYVTEAGNPENRRGVRGVELFLPSPLLEGGLCLVDTPGIGSVLEGNSAETRAFVPHLDAALLVLGADPPISPEELTLLGEVVGRVPDVLVVVSKVDRLETADVAEARRFTEGILASRLPTPVPEIFEVSALERLRTGLRVRDWAALERRLEELADSGGARLVEAARERGLATLGARLRHHLHEDRAALLSPVEATERRIAELRRCAASAEQSVVELGHLFDAETGRLSSRFAAERDRLVNEAWPGLVEEIQERLAPAPVARGPKLRRYALEQAQAVTERVADGFLHRLGPEAEREFATVTERFVGQANAFLGRLADAGELPREALPFDLAPEAGLRVRSRFQYFSLMRLTTPAAATWLADVVRPPRAARRAAERAALELARRLLEVNSSRVVGDLEERIVESRRSVEAAVRRTLRDVVSAAETAAARASELRNRGEDAVREALDTIVTLLREVDAVAARPQGAAGSASSDRGRPDRGGGSPR